MLWATALVAVWLTIFLGGDAFFRSGRGDVLGRMLFMAIYLTLPGAAVGAACGRPYLGAACGFASFLAALVWTLFDIRI